MNQQNNTSKHITTVISNFCTEGESYDYELYGSGHINESFYVKSRDNGHRDYLLQRINHHIFKDVPGLMSNIKLVTDHLKSKLPKVAKADVHSEVLTLVPTKDNQYYSLDQDGNYWRMYDFLHTNRYDVLETEQQAYEGGKAFGKFQAMLSDMDAGDLIETIPQFHNVEMRLNRFDSAVHADVADRVKVVAAEIDFIQSRAQAMKAILNSSDESALPVRIIHNDTKFNNVLLDKQDRAQCVIDLDTVMPGYVAFDFGDAIRTIINTAAEDEEDLDKIQLNVPLFKAYTEGYLEQAGFFLSPAEIESLVKGVLLIPYEQIVRFLTDYIEGDTYYKIHFPEHNLQRTRAQIELLKKLEDEYDTLEQIVQEITEQAIQKNHLKIETT
ncbi:MAG: aminoglycoside phosphotransferase family protein [Bacteroidota bacterium]